MRIVPVGLVTALLLLVPPPEALRAQEQAPSPVEARIWLDRGVDPVFQQGDYARVYYRATRDAYVSIFHLDTDGVVRILQPDGVGTSHRVRGGRDYRLLFPGSGEWLVEEDPGVGYFFVLASEEPLDLDLAASDFPLERDGAGAGQLRVSQDPHWAMDAVAETVAPEGPGGRPFDLAFTAYQVGQSYSYPRFLCYACHAAEPFEAWNPYQDTCSDFRVVIDNDPYFYPGGTGRGGRVEVARSSGTAGPQFTFRAREDGEPGTPLVMSGGVVGPETGRDREAGSREALPGAAAENASPSTERPHRPTLERRGEP